MNEPQTKILKIAGLLGLIVVWLGLVLSVRYVVRLAAAAIGIPAVPIALYILLALLLLWPLMSIVQKLSDKLDKKKNPL